MPLRASVSYSGGDRLTPCSMSTHRLTTVSGRPVCRYALGGAARSMQPESLPSAYRDLLPSADGDAGAPFYFYYNPHRYPAFLSGVSSVFDDVDDERKPNREDAYVASGGAERSPAALDERLVDALAYSGGEYLDAFVLEYVLPYELTSGGALGGDLERAVERVHSMKREGRVRHVIASTHSHEAGAALAAARLSDGMPAFDALMLRYGMSHRRAAESLSLPAALENGLPVLAFTTTRWNRHLEDFGPAGRSPNGASLPSASDCVKFALQHPAIEVVLHSARDEEELEGTLVPLFAASSLSSGGSSWLSEDELERWQHYGGDEMKWNEKDQFDEYPDELLSR